MERAIKNWFINPKTPFPFIVQDSIKTYLLISILVLIVLAALFGPLTDIIPPEDLCRVQPDQRPVSRSRAAIYGRRRNQGR